MNKAGPYLLQRRLGAGGMGVVWLGVHEETGAEHAIKTLHPNADAETQARFRREGEAQARVDGHPNVVRVRSAGYEGSTPYLALELATGGDLEERLRRGPLEPEQAVKLVQGLARGLAHVHAAGILHRDLKPANVLFDEAGTPKLVDFGLARLDRAQALTATGELLGTPAYMAPEQAMAVDELTPRADVYGLGAVLYACLSGSPPFQEETSLATLSSVLSDPPIPLSSGVPEGLAKLCMRCLEKDPSARFASAEALAAALETWDELPAPLSPGRKALLALAAASLLVALGAIAFAANRPSLLETAAAELEAGAPASALTSYEAHLVKHPDSVEAAAGRAEALWALGRRAEGLAALTSLALPSPGGPLATRAAAHWRSLAEEQREARAWWEAAESSAQAARLAPESPSQTLARGWLSLRLGRIDEALELAEAAVSECSGSELPGEGLGEALLLRARARSLRPALRAKAASDYADALGFLPHQARAWAERARFAHVFGGTDPDPLLKRALELDPQEPLALALRGEQGLARGDFDPAPLAAFEGSACARALLLRQRAAAPLRLNRGAQMHLLLEGLDLDPWDPDLNEALATILASSAAYAEADLHYTRAILVRPQPSVRRARLEVRRALEDWEGALEDSGALVRIGLRERSSALRHGALLVRSGRPATSYFRWLQEWEGRASSIEDRLFYAEINLSLGRAGSVLSNLYVERQGAVEKVLELTEEEGAAVLRLRAAAQELQANMARGELVWAAARATADPQNRRLRFGNFLAVRPVESVSAWAEFAALTLRLGTRSEFMRAAGRTLDLDDRLRASGSEDRRPKDRPLARVRHEELLRQLIEAEVAAGDWRSARARLTRHLANQGLTSEERVRLLLLRAESREALGQLLEAEGDLRAAATLAVEEATGEAIRQRLQTLRALQASRAK